MCQHAYYLPCWQSNLDTKQQDIRVCIPPYTFLIGRGCVVPLPTWLITANTIMEIVAVIKTANQTVDPKLLWYVVQEPPIEICGWK